MESTLSKLFTLLIAIGFGYVAYQKTAGNPPPMQHNGAKSPQASSNREAPPNRPPPDQPIVVVASDTLPQVSGAQPKEQLPAVTSSARPPEPQTRPADVNDVNAVPLANPTTLRRAYYDFLSKRNPRAFLICKSGSVKVLAGDMTFINRQIAESAGQCSPYAIDDNVVWTGN